MCIGELILINKSNYITIKKLNFDSYIIVNNA